MTWRVEPAQEPDLWAVVCDTPLGLAVAHGVESHGSPVITVLYPSQWHAQQVADDLNWAVDDDEG